MFFKIYNFNRAFVSQFTYLKINSQYSLGLMSRFKNLVSRFTYHKHFNVSLGPMYIDLQALVNLWNLFLHDVPTYSKYTTSVTQQKMRFHYIFLLQEGFCRYRELDN